MSAVTILLSYPPKELQPNFRSRSHWPKTRAIAAYRHEAWVEARRAMNAKGLIPWVNGVGYQVKYLRPPVTASVEFIVKVQRGRDGDNAIASLKAAFDGIVDARLLSGDTADKLTIMPPTFVKGERAAVAITLTEASS